MRKKIPYSQGPVILSGPICWIFGHILRQQGVTLFGNIHLTHKWRKLYRAIPPIADPLLNKRAAFSVIAHESYHSWDQSKTGHIAWLFVYLVTLAFCLLRYWFWYKPWLHHPMERLAYKFEREFYTELYS